VSSTPEQSQQPEPATGSRAETKRAAILDAAGQVFLAKGYVGTSMDEIASVAAVSKQTVYKHFADKETLFHELITATVHTTGESVPDDPILVGDQPLDEELAAYARHLLHGVMQPRVVQLRRLVIGEATRFPALGRSFYDLGLARTIDALATVFARLADDSQLQLDDPPLAAEHFIWLVLSIPLNRAMLLGDNHSVRAEDLDHYADAGVDTFLAAYTHAPRSHRAGRATPGRGSRTSR
jgi:TetR/AcrR family transcriptional regulator, mexJK operon transcriptional repressor